MKKIIINFLALIITGFSMNLKAIDPIKVDPFHSIIVSSEILAELVASEVESIETDFENADVENLIVEVVDSVLKLRMKTGNYNSATLKVKIYYINPPNQLEAKGRAQIWSAGEIDMDKALNVRLDNGGEMRLILNCDSLNANLSKGSIIHLQGKTRALYVKTSTSATFSGYEFESERAEVIANGYGKAKVSVSKYLNASASSKGFVGYVGEPDKVDQKTSMKGEISKAILE